MTDDFQPASRSERYAGLCVGGPYDGRRQVHYTNKLSVAIGPTYGFIDLTKESFEDEIDVTGGYTFDEVAKVWIWQRT